MNGSQSHYLATRMIRANLSVKHTIYGLKGLKNSSCIESVLTLKHNNVIMISHQMFRSLK